MRPLGGTIEIFLVEVGLHTMQKMLQTTKPYIAANVPSKHIKAVPNDH